MQGGPTAEITLAGSTVQASVPTARCARMVTRLGGNGVPQPGKFPGFFQKSTDPHEGYTWKVARKIIFKLFFRGEVTAGT